MKELSILETQQVSGGLNILGNSTGLGILGDDNGQPIPTTDTSLIPQQGVVYTTLLGLDIILDGVLGATNSTNGNLNAI